MLKKLIKLRIGLRTIKTAAAVILSMVIVYFYGTTDSRFIFAMLGAMAAVQPSFKESLESCMTQIVGVIIGALMGIVLMNLPIHDLAACGIGIVVVITAYNTLRIRFSPGLACLIVVILCITPDISPVEYAAGRIWDTAIGLSVGMALNTLVFPYDNSAQIRATVQSLDKEVIRFLEDMYDGDDVLPDAEQMVSTIDEMARQFSIFSNQKFLRDRIRKQKQLETFQVCSIKARQLVAHMEVLSHMGNAGHLSRATLARLKACGADIRQDYIRDAIQEKDLIINYHINKLLTLREELLDALEQ
jgi:uncharacterized membrane protein YgaE (UPF0421/DUF939 family)